MSAAPQLVAMAYCWWPGAAAAADAGHSAGVYAWPGTAHSPAAPPLPTTSPPLAADPRPQGHRSSAVAAHPNP
eukprot:1140098-Pelagomonas_calceolata.AAC.3